MDMPKTCMIGIHMYVGQHRLRLIWLTYKYVDRHVFCYKVSTNIMHTYHTKCTIGTQSRHGQIKSSQPIRQTQSIHGLSLSTLNISIVKKQFTPLSSIQSFILMTHKLFIELAVFKFCANLDKDQDWSLAKHHGHSNDRVSIDIC